MALHDCKLGEEQLSLRGYSLLRGDCPAGEAALLINQRVVHTELTLNSPLYATAATVTLNKTFTTYLTPNEIIHKTYSRKPNWSTPETFPFSRWFQGSLSWVGGGGGGGSRRDGPGKLIESLLADTDLTLLNSKTPTFLHSAYHTTSAIDLAVASPTIALDLQWSVHDDLCGSDDFPISLTSHTEADTARPAFNLKKANWNLFGDLCTRSIDQKNLWVWLPCGTLHRKNYRGCQGSRPSLSWRE